MTRGYAQNTTSKNNQKIRLNNLILLSLSRVFFKLDDLAYHNRPRLSVFR